MSEMLDSDGYPTEAALLAVEKWDGADIYEWFALIQSIWKYSDNGYWDGRIEVDDILNRKVHRFYLSTAGWSGNESIIDAMKNNHIMWMLSWYSSKRGGHYVFQLEID